MENEMGDVIRFVIAERFTAFTNQLCYFTAIEAARLFTVSAVAVPNFHG